MNLVVADVFYDGSNAIAIRIKGLETGGVVLAIERNFVADCENAKVQSQAFFESLSIDMLKAMVNFGYMAGPEMGTLHHIPKTETTPEKFAILRAGSPVTEWNPDRKQFVVVPATK